MKNKSGLLRRVCVIALLLLTGVAAKAEASNSFFVKVGDKEDTFAISDVRELTFGDEALTVVKNDNTQISFTGDWMISFGNTDIVGVGEMTFSASDSPAEVYDLQGIRVLKATRLSEMDLKELPAGTYIIKCGQKTLKIKL